MDRRMENGKKRRRRYGGERSGKTIIIIITVEHIINKIWNIFLPNSGQNCSSGTTYHSG